MFGGIISSLVTNAVKTTVKSSFRIDELTNKLKENCPSNQELEKIINQKNQLNETLGLVQTNFNTLNSVTNTIDDIVPPINTVITFIKTIPLPASFPPGVGVPLNLITKLSDTLENLKDLIQQGRVSIKGAQQASRVISSNIGKVQSKLNQLDAIIFICANQTGYTGDLSSGTSGITSNPAININLNEQLEGRLSSNSTNPLIYKGWRLILQNDPNNTFSFPRRRVIAQKPSLNNNGIQTLISNFGPPGSEGYSYSSSTQVLVDDIKFKIDNPNWRPDSVIESLNEVEAAAEAAAATAAEIAAQAARQAEELKRGKVVFFGQTGALSNIPLGDFGGYGAGEYSFTGDVDGLRPEQSSERISSVRVGRGMKLTIFYSSNFLTKPGISPNDPNLQNLSRRVFEHPFDATTDYIEAYVGDEFNDNVNSFIIDKLPGGTITELPPERLALYIPAYALKRRSIKILVDSSNQIIKQNNRFDGYVPLNNKWGMPSDNIGATVRISDEQDPIQVASSTFGLGIHQFIENNKIDTWIYNNNTLYNSSEFNNSPPPKERINLGKEFYMEKIS
jgi:hypothetical protein